MKLMDLLVEEINNDLPKELKEQGLKVERLHSKPVELVSTPRGIRHRDIETGKFCD